MKGFGIGIAVGLLVGGLAVTGWIGSGTASASHDAPQKSMTQDYDDFMRDSELKRLKEEEFLKPYRSSKPC